MKKALVCSLLLTTLLPGIAPGAAPDPGKPAAWAHEIVVRSAAQFHVPADVATFVDAAAATGARGISVLVKQDEDREIGSGWVFYPSRIAPVAAGYDGFDVLGTLVAAAHRRGLAVTAWIPQFHDQAAAAAHPDWAMQYRTATGSAPYRGSHAREYFVNPMDDAVQAYELSIIREVVDRYPVDGVMLDWIRFDDFPMDMSASTRTRFEKSHGVDPITIDMTVDSAQRRSWNAFRTAAIAAYVHRVRQAVPARLRLGVFILPPEFIEVAQDAAQFRGDVDVLAPMCYSYDWDFPLAWIWRQCLPQTFAKAAGVEVAPTLDSHLGDADYRDITQALHSDLPQIHQIFWFFHDTWTAEALAHVARVSHD